MIRHLLFLIAGTLAFWLLAGLPARFVWGDAALVYCGVSLLLCLVPAAATLIWAGRALTQGADRQLVMVLGGTGVRMFAVLLGGLALCQMIPYLQEQPGFWIWLGISYVYVLTLEIALILAGRGPQPRQGESPNG